MKSQHESKLNNEDLVRQLKATEEEERRLRKLISNQELELEDTKHKVLLLQTQLSNIAEELQIASNEKSKLAEKLRRAIIHHDQANQKVRRINLSS